VVHEAVHGVDTPEQLDHLNEMIKDGTIKMTNV
jgi:hypothetical protein